MPSSLRLRQYVRGSKGMLANARQFTGRLVHVKLQGFVRPHPLNRRVFGERPQDGRRLIRTPLRRTAFAAENQHAE
jgi:hypothetical protein